MVAELNELPVGCSHESTQEVTKHYCINPHPLHKKIISHNFAHQEQNYVIRCFPNAAMYAGILGLLFSVLVSFFDDFWLQFGWFTPSWASLGPVGCSRGVPDAPKSDF